MKHSYSCFSFNPQTRIFNTNVCRIFSLSFQDINECSASPCAPNATCTNTNGSFTCDCHQFYQGDGFVCTGKISIFRAHCLILLHYILLRQT